MNSKEFLGLIEIPFFLSKKMNGEDNFFLRSSSLNDICLYLKQKMLGSLLESAELLMLSLVHSPLIQITYRSH